MAYCTLCGELLKCNELDASLCARCQQTVADAEYEAVAGPFDYED